VFAKTHTIVGPETGSGEKMGPKELKSKNRVSRRIWGGVIEGSTQEAGTTPQAILYHKASDSGTHMGRKEWQGCSQGRYPLVGRRIRGYEKSASYSVRGVKVKVFTPRWLIRSFIRADTHRRKNALTLSVIRQS